MKLTAKRGETPPDTTRPAAPSNLLKITTAELLKSPQMHACTMHVDAGCKGQDRPKPPKMRKGRRGLRLHSYLGTARHSDSRRQLLAASLAAPNPQTSNLERSLRLQHLCVLHEPVISIGTAGPGPPHLRSFEPPSALHSLNNQAASFLCGRGPWKRASSGSNGALPAWPSVMRLLCAEVARGKLCEAGVLT